MYSSSDSDEFYDAEDITPNHGTRKSRKSSKASLTLKANSEPNISKLNKEDVDNSKVDGNSEKQFKLTSIDSGGGVGGSSISSNRNHPITGRKKFKELRAKLQNDDEEGLAGNITPPNSQGSSIDGIFASSSKTSHPFRIIEQDTVSLQSINSVGRVARILGPVAEGIIREGDNNKGHFASTWSSSSLDSESTPSSKGTSKYPSSVTISTLTTAQQESGNNGKTVVPLQEPDVIASTKSSSNTVLNESGGGGVVAPIAPPRRKKKNRICATINKSQSSAAFETSSTSSSSTAATAVTTTTLLPPVTTTITTKNNNIVESFTKEIENTLENLTTVQSSLPTSTITTAITKFNKTAEFLQKSLDIKQAIKGQFVVKPQDNDSTKAQQTTIETTIKETSEKRPISSSGRKSVGHYSLGPHRGSRQTGNMSTKERRRSAGDENMLNGANMHVRTHTDSGKQLSDLEILEQVTVLNLDTGERMPLSVAEDKLPQCINPLSLHIMRLTSEYVSSSSVEKEKESDDESIDAKKSDIPSGDDLERVSLRKKTGKLKRFVGSAMKKAKSIAQEVSHARHKEDIIDVVDNVHPGEQNIKLKASNSHKGPYEFEKVEHVQELRDEHEGPIWCMKFSCCGRLLATAGQDKILRIWIIKDAFPFFQDMRTKYNAEKVSPTPSQESLVSHHSAESTSLLILEAMHNENSDKLTFMPKPFCTYTGHTSDLLDVSWSKNYFILSSSMDKTVRLWHISRKECLCCFQHIDFVTAIVFHPRDDRYFLSGSLDGKLRLWNIPDKKVAVWNEVEGNPKLITAANFCQNGKFAVVGTYDGRCIFYNTDQLKYHTQIHVRSTRGRNSTGRKISGIEPMPGEDKILITSNDSRIRLYDLRDLNVSCKYKGCVNTSSQIKASFSHDGKYIISGSENRDIYIWKTNHDYAKFSSVRRDRNDFWEAIKAHNAVVTCAIFAPNPEFIIKMIEENCNKQHQQPDDTKKIDDPMVEQHTKGYGGYVLVSADFNGCIKVFINKMKPKHSSLPASAMA